MSGGHLRVLRIKNFRRYYFAQLLSQTGTWLQFMGQIWLVVVVLAPGNALALGITGALQAAPVVFMLFGGSLADGLDRRRLIVATQLASGVLALVLGLSAYSGHVSLAIVWACAFGLGFVNAVDAPARQGFIGELVDAEARPSAIALNSAAFQGTRAVGVALAPVLVTKFGGGAPFVANAVSFALMALVVQSLDRTQLLPQPRTATARPPIGEGLSAIRRSPAMAAPLALLAFVAVFALNFNLTIPLLATVTLGGGLALASECYVASSAGAVLCSVLLSVTDIARERVLVVAAVALAACMAAAAYARNDLVALALMVPLGASIVAITTSVNTILQTRCEGSMRGRVMSVYSLILNGANLIGNPLIGVVTGLSFVGVPGSWLIGTFAIAGGLVVYRVLRPSGAVSGMAPEATA